MTRTKRSSALHKARCATTLIAKRKTVIITLSSSRERISRSHDFLHLISRFSDLDERKIEIAAALNGANPSVIEFQKYSEILEGECFATLAVLPAISSDVSINLKSIFTNIVNFVAR